MTNASVEEADRLLPSVQTKKNNNNNFLLYSNNNNEVYCVNKEWRLMRGLERI
jgi:hypothetical protein